MRHVYVLGVVMSGWVFFRSESLSSALNWFKAMLGFGDGDGLLYNAVLLVRHETVLCVVAGVVFSMPVLRHLRAAAARCPVNFRGYLFGAETAVTLVLLVTAATRIVAGTYNPFIYFRF
jgi:alginate O-acetyltransferase complex protein AlgI